MSRNGRPLRFMTVVLGMWIGARVYLLWPDAPLPPALREAVRRTMPRGPQVASAPPMTASARARDPGSRRPPAPPASLADHARTAPVHTAAPGTTPAPASPPAGGESPATDSPAYVLALLGMVRYGAPEPPPATARRWSASGWSILRGAGRGGGVATPQLGGSQAGVRIARTLDAHGRLAVAARVAAALDTRQQEAAVGLEWRPARLPVRVVAERRIGVANIRGGTALGLAGGIDAQPLAAGFRLDGYAQAGAVARGGVEGYADGAVRLARPLFRTASGATLDLGVGAWGAAQRGARRLDAGPAATLVLPVGDGPRVRIALEWRQRILGNARPASGPALSIGADY